MKRRVSILFLAVLLSALAVSAQQVSNGRSAKLERLLQSMGYNVKYSEVAPTVWEKDEFGLEAKSVYSIKSRKPVPRYRDLYYRFSVVIETYPDQVHAQNRLQRIIETPPGVDSKMEPEYVLREGFRRGNLIYTVSTDVYKFVVEGELTKFRTKLEDAVPDPGDQEGRYVPCGPVVVSTVQGRCRSIADAGKRYFSYSLTFDIEKVVSGEFAGKEVTFEAKPSWVKDGTVEARLIDALKVTRDPDGSLCDPTIPLSLTFEQELGDRGAVTRTTLKHFEPSPISTEPSRKIEDRPSTVRDFLMLIPEEYFVFEGCWPDRDPGCRRAKLEYLKQLVEVEDIANGYIKGGCDGAQRCMEMAVFKRPDGSHLIGLHVHAESIHDFYFLEYKDGQWTNVSGQAIPSFEGKHYELPRYGTTVGVFEARVIDKGTDWVATERGKKLYELEWRNGEFRIKK